MSPDGIHAYVTGQLSDSLAVVDVGTNPSSPVVVGGIVGDTVNMDGAFGVAVSSDGKFV